MKQMFNKTFYRFTLGFISILIASFVLASIVSSLDAKQEAPVSRVAR